MENALDEIKARMPYTWSVREVELLTEAIQSLSDTNELIATKLRELAKTTEPPNLLIKEEPEEQQEESKKENVNKKTKLYAMPKGKDIIGVGVDDTYIELRRQEADVLAHLILEAVKEQVLHQKIWD